MALTQSNGILAPTLLLATSLFLAACTAPGDTPAATATEPEPATITQPAAPQAPAAVIAATRAKPSMPTTALGRDAARACKTSADCAVKDAGSCCGYRPACVNKDTPTFPEKVKAACATEGRMGICGFPVIDGCQCVSGTCEGVPMMENSAPLQ